MKVILVNGSPHEKGTTAAALGEVAAALHEEGVETEILQLGSAAVHGCIACRKCAETKRCVFDGDLANRLIEKMQTADGLVVGSPVYYAGPNGALCAVLDRAFYAGSAFFAHKPGAAVAVCRRGGNSATLDRLNKYFTICQMPLVSSRYWNIAHGAAPGEVQKDAEGLNTLYTLGENMAFLLAGKAALQAPPPAHKPLERTNFIR